ncbi:cytoskeletal protein RodZ [Alkalibacillus flavidus]|uniref:Cytoskeletal protein RodZ n=1 Tax=Alkalibacillus flavidus TaxID=546021 RepID=A0ABV2KX16_9BACI
MFRVITLIVVTISTLGVIAFTFTQTTDDTEREASANTSESSKVENESTSTNQSSQESTNDKKNQSSNEGISTAAQAEKAVRHEIDLPEEGEYTIIFDHHNDAGDWVVHVYEVVERKEGSHQATFGWYIVDQNSGEVTSMFGE